MRELSQEEIMTIEGGNIANKIGGSLKIAGGIVGIMSPDPFTSTAGIYAIAVGISDWRK